MVSHEREIVQSSLKKTDSGHRERIIMATGLSVEIFFLLILIF